MKRFTALILVIISLTTFLNVSAFAAEEPYYITIYRPTEGEVFGKYYGMEAYPDGYGRAVLYFSNNFYAVSYYIIFPDEYIGKGLIPETKEFCTTLNLNMHYKPVSYDYYCTTGKMYYEPPEGEYELIIEGTEMRNGERITLTNSVTFYYDPEKTETMTEFELSKNSEKTGGVTVTESGANASSSGSAKVGVIEVDPKVFTVEVGESKDVKVTSTAGLSVEIEDESVIDASLSNGILTVTGKKKGESAVWLRSSENYMNVEVTVVPAAEKPQTGIKDILKKLFESLEQFGQ